MQNGKLCTSFLLMYLRNFCPPLAPLSLRRVSWKIVSSRCLSLLKSTSIKSTISLLPVVLLGYHFLITVIHLTFCLNSLSSLPILKIKSRILSSLVVGVFFFHNLYQKHHQCISRTSWIICVLPYSFPNIFYSQNMRIYIWYLDSSFPRQNSLLTSLSYHITSLLFQLDHNFDHVLRLHISSGLFLLTMVIEEVQTEPAIYIDLNNPVPPSFCPGPRLLYMQLGFLSSFSSIENPLLTRLVNW